MGIPEKLSDINRGNVHQIFRKKAILVPRLPFYYTREMEEIMDSRGRVDWDLLHSLDNRL